MKEHDSVLTQETIKALSIKPDGVYIDLTFGRGGHSRKILKQLSQYGRLIVIDQDIEAIKSAREQFHNDHRVAVKYTSFSMISEVIYDLKLYGKIDGILLDLGVSSPQIDNSARGFSFMGKSPLDMRMNVRAGNSAISLIDKLTFKQIEKMLVLNGEERNARYFSGEICAKRKLRPIITNKQLASVSKTQKHKRGIHPATRLFQTIRIAVNGEISGLKKCLLDSWDSLNYRGKLVVISFHSLEDKIIKQFSKGRANPNLIVERVGSNKKSTRPKKKEICYNPRSRSAHLRVIEKK